MIAILCSRELLLVTVYYFQIILQLNTVYQSLHSYLQLVSLLNRIDEIKKISKKAS